MSEIKVAFITNHKKIRAIHHLRIIGPAAYTDTKLFICHKNLDGLSEILDKAQVFVIQRDFPVDYKFYLYLSEKSQKNNIPIVYDLDDDLFNLPTTHPNRLSNSYTNALIPMMEAALSADYVTVSTNFMKKTLSALNKNIFVFSNYLDDKIWDFTPPKIKNNDQKITLGYMGGASHKPDIESIVNVLINLIQEYPNKLKLHFYGLKPPDILMNYPNTIWTPIKTYQYENFAQDFQKIDVDFFIAPLRDNNFNKCKSGIKFFEYSAVGAPGVFSRLEPYEGIINDGENGFLASSEEEWNEKIQLLIHDPELRYQLTTNAQKIIKQNYLMSKNSCKWKSLYEDFIEGKQSGKKIRNVPHEMIKNIAIQISEFNENNKELLSSYKKERVNFQRKITVQEKENKILEKIIVTQKRKIKNLEEEVLFYAQSKSWRATRPIRKIIKNFEK